MTKKPKIAITCSFEKESDSYTMPKGYVEVLAKNGAIPYIIPHLPDKELKAQEIIGDVDGLLLSGGGRLRSKIVQTGTQIQVILYRTGTRPSRNRTCAGSPKNRPSFSRHMQGNPGNQHRCRG